MRRMSICRRRAHRANDILQNMVDAGFLSEGQIYAAQRNPATPVPRSRDIAPDWYLDWAYDQVRQLAEEHKLGDDRTLTVRTALDPNLQKFADQTIEDQLRQYGPAYHADQSAMVILDPSNGAVRTIVGGRDYGASQFNRATDALRQPGSSFKPFVYLTALLTGKFTPQTIVVDGPVCIGDWCPHNFGGGYHGACAARHRAHAFAEFGRRQTLDRDRRSLSRPRPQQCL